MNSHGIELHVDDAANVELPEGLSILRSFLLPDGKRYRQATWLLSDFDRQTWDVDSKNRFQINWAVRVGRRRELLTSPKHSGLLETLKSWVIVQTHPDFTGRLNFSPQSDYNSLRRVLAFADHFLLHFDELGLARHGLAGISTGELAAIVGALASHRDNSVALYEWPKRLAKFLRENLPSEPEAARVVSEAPFLARDIPAAEKRMLDLDETELVRARAWLWSVGLYQSRATAEGCRYSVNNREIAAELFRETLVGKFAQVRPAPELGLLPGYRLCLTEMPAAPVSTGKSAARSRSSLNLHLDTLRSLNVLRADGLPAPDVNMATLSSLSRHFELKENGRFKTLPFDVVMRTLRGAITFGLKFGPQIIDSYLSIADAAHRAQKTVALFANQVDIRPLIHRDLLDLGVSQWTVQPPGSYMPAENYYRDLRENKGLYELTRVFYGTAEMTVGALSARRIGELLDLTPGRSIDESGTRLIFENRKSGIGGLRDQIARPLPPVAITMLRQFERLQVGLQARGLIDQLHPLFCYPIALGSGHLGVLTPGSYNDSLDLMCDYFETPTDDLGRRIYIRQHQLRRWFAMLFFWSNSFGGVDTLRWFLGHTDMEHLYRYITENLPGAVLRDVSASWAKESLRRGAEETHELAEAVARHFGTSDFRAMEEEKLELYLDDLLATGRLVVEPVFMDKGRSCRICVRLSQREPICG